MQQPSLSELNSRLAQAGLTVHLDAAAAARLKAAAPRERVLSALGRVEQQGDRGARRFLENLFAKAELISPAADAPRHPVPPVRQGPVHRQEPARSNRQTPSGLAERANASRVIQGRLGSDKKNGASRGFQARSRPQHHVYGGRSALTFELDETTAGVPTVALDGAQSVGERRYDWKSKVRVQFTAGELPVVAAVLLGILPECHFSNHGPANDKGFEIAWQGERGHFFVKVWQGKGNLRAVPMTREDAFHVTQIVLRAIQQASPARLDTAGVIATLRAFYGRA